jgi:hypothetical protein
MKATYSPEDNKLRLYAETRLDKELYGRVRSNGFIWAPKQKLFVAPMWTPERADFLEELVGEIEDEDKSLVERKEPPAVRARRIKGLDADLRKQVEHAGRWIIHIQNRLVYEKAMLKESGGGCNDKDN